MDAIVKMHRSGTPPDPLCVLRGSGPLTAPRPHDHPKEIVTSERET